MARMPGEFYYGFEPSEPEAVGECALCGEEVYNEDYMIGGEVVCPSCRAYWDSDDIILDYAKAHCGSLPEFLKGHRYEDWFEGFCEAMRDEFGEDIYEWIKN